MTDSSEILTVDKRKHFEAHDPYGRDYAGGIKLSFDEFQPVEREKYRSHNPSYVMKRHPHGIAVIIHNKNFTPPRLSTLEGANNDEYNLKETFRFLGYKVEIYRDCTAKEICHTFENMVTVRSTEFAGHDSFVCCIVSHGAMGKKIFTHDSLTIDLNDDIASKLMDCETLQGKPKMFFIQACVGSGRDEGVSVPAGGKQVPQELITRLRYIGTVLPKRYATRLRIWSRCDPLNLQAMTALSAALYHTGQWGRRYLPMTV